MHDPGVNRASKIEQRHDDLVGLCVSMLENQHQSDARIGSVLHMLQELVRAVCSTAGLKISLLCSSVFILFWGGMWGTHCFLNSQKDKLQ